MTEPEFCQALKQRYPSPDFVLLPQVRNQTGFSRTVRTADAIAISTYPSRGIDVHGFEFKDSRTDWLKELKDPAKSEEIGRFCAYWWLVVSKFGIAFADEVPPAWGLLEIQTDGLKVVRKAPRREIQEPTWGFVAAVLRAAAEVVTEEAVIEKRIQKAVNAALDMQSGQHQEAMKRLSKHEREEVEQLHRVIRDFEESSGVDIRNWPRAKKIGEVVKFVLDGGLEEQRRELERAESIAIRVKHQIGSAIEELKAGATCPE